MLLSTIKALPRAYPPIGGFGFDANLGPPSGFMSSPDIRTSECKFGYTSSGMWTFFTIDSNLDWWLGLPYSLKIFKSGSGAQSFCVLSRNIN